MGEILDKAVARLGERIDSFDGTVRFDIENEGSIMIDDKGVRAAGEGEAPPDATLSADADTFRQMLEGDLNPTAAFMSGKLRVEGDMGAAMRLGSALG